MFIDFVLSFKDGVTQVWMCVMTCKVVVVHTVLLQYCILGCDKISQWRGFIIPLCFHLCFTQLFFKNRRKSKICIWWIITMTICLSCSKFIYFFPHNLTITIITRAKLTLGKSFCISQRPASLHMQPAQSEQLNYFRKLCVELMFPHRGGGDGSMPMR